MIAESSQLNAFDYGAIILFLVGTLGLGLFIGRRLHTGTDFFLAGRKLPWWAIGVSLVATDIGGTDIIGVGGTAYKHGLAVANFEWIGCVPAMIVAAFVFVPAFYRAGVFTIPEFLELRYNVGVRSVLAICWTLFMACNLGIMLVASAKMMSSIFGWSEVACLFATALLVGFYTSVGGLAAVVYTDLIQGIVMIAGCMLVLVLGLIEVGGIGRLQERIHEIEAQQITATESTGEESHATRLILPVDTETPFPWPGIYFGLALILSPAYWIGNQAIVQRSLGARSEFDAKASYIWGAFLKNLIPLIVAIPGLIALALIPDLEDGDQAFPELVGRLLPMGLRGIFVAAFLAALMSSIDSYLNSASTVVSHDLYRRFFDRDASAHRLLIVGRTTTLCLVAWAIGFAFVLRSLDDDSGLYAIFQTLMAFFQGPAFAVLVLGVFWKRATGRAALVGLLSGIVVSIGLFTLNQPAVYTSLGWEPLFQIQDPFLYFSIWSFLTTAVLTIVLSFVTRPEPDEKLAYVVGRKDPSPTTTEA